MRKLEKKLSKREIDINLKILNTPELFLLDPDFDECIVGVSRNGAVIYDFGEMVFDYSQIHEDELSNYEDDFCAFIVDCELKIESYIDGLTNQELKGKQKPVLISLNHSFYTFKD